MPYAQIVNPKYQTPQHVRMIAGVLQDVEAGKIKRACITLHPRAGKSELTSGIFPSWCLGRDPSRKFILTSYAQRLAETFSEQNRDTIALNPGFREVFPEVTISPTKKGRDLWAVMGERESLLAAGVGGAITGFGAWGLLIDDPFKNHEEANSAALRERVWNWYLTTSRTRLQADGWVIIIATRWHEDDLTGRLMQTREWKDFHHLHIPALSYGSIGDYEDDGRDEYERKKFFASLPVDAFPDPMGRPKGEPCWPDRFGIDFLVDARETMGHHFEALYQGNPTAPEGQKFKREWFRPITDRDLEALPIEVKARSRSYDLAWSASKTADFTVGLRATLYQVDHNGDSDHPLLSALPPVMIVIEDLLRYQKEWDENEDLIIDAALTDGSDYELLVEAVASQNKGVKSLRKNPRLWRHNIIPVVPSKGKEERANYSLGLASHGAVFILYPHQTVAPFWETDFLNELGGFPLAAKDDQVDALTQVIDFWQDQIDEAMMQFRPTTWDSGFGEYNSINPERVENRPPELIEVPSDQYTFDNLGWL
jgi:predicted phage terminase large subunit-like protein